MYILIQIQTGETKYLNDFTSMYFKCMSHHISKKNSSSSLIKCEHLLGEDEFLVGISLVFLNWFGSRIAQIYSHQGTPHGYLNLYFFLFGINFSKAQQYVLMRIRIVGVIRAKKFKLLGLQNFKCSTQSGWHLRKYKYLIPNLGLNLADNQAPPIPPRCKGRHQPYSVTDITGAEQLIVLTPEKSHFVTCAKFWTQKFILQSVQFFSFFQTANQIFLKEWKVSWLQPVKIFEPFYLSLVIGESFAIPSCKVGNGAQDARRLVFELDYSLSLSTGSKCTHYVLTRRSGDCLWTKL